MNVVGNIKKMVHFHKSDNVYVSEKCHSAWRDSVYNILQLRCSFQISCNYNRPYAFCENFKVFKKSNSNNNFQIHIDVKDPINITKLVAHQQNLHKLCYCFKNFHSYENLNQSTLCYCVFCLTCHDLYSVLNEDFNELSCFSKTY